MKRNILKVALPIALVWISALQASSQDDLSCSNDLLTGSYGFVLNGTIVGVGSLAIVGVAKFDGAGNWSRHETAVVNGRVLLPESIVGTYQVNADCTGSTADAQGHHSQFCNRQPRQGDTLYRHRCGSGEHYYVEEVVDFPKCKD